MTACLKCRVANLCTAGIGFSAYGEGNIRTAPTYEGCSAQNSRGRDRAYPLRALFRHDRGRIRFNGKTIQTKNTVWF